MSGFLTTCDRSLDSTDRIHPPVDGGCVQVLTVNVEDYYQAAVFHRYVQARNWYRFDSRLQANIETTLATLAAHDTKATFFVLGWIAEQHPELVRMIVDAGHEVGSRGHLHQPLLSLSKADRMDDLLRSRKSLEDITGTPVRGFRMSDGWLKRADLNFLEEVYNAGYEYDSSLMPRRRDFRDQPHRRLVHQHALSQGQILEIPPSTAEIAGAWVPIAGGNYQRQLPDSLMRSAVQRWTRTEASPYVMYFQIWEMDTEQPELSVVGRLSRLRHYRNLDKYNWLLPRYLKAWNFTSIEQHAHLPSSPLSSLAAAKVRSVASETASECIPVRLNSEDSLSIPQCADSGNAIIDHGRPVSFHSPRVTQKSATLVIPCFNEESSLPYLARTLEHLKNTLSKHYSISVLFVDDCSTDNTRQLLQSLFGTEPDVRILHHEQNKGVSAAILTGIAAAETEIVCSMDCDCSYDPHELEQMLPLLTTDVSMVTASPYHRDGGVRNVPGWRLTLSHGLSVMYRVLLRQRLATWTSCFRVYRKSQILDLPLFESGFLGTAELAAQLSLHKRKIVEHPAVLEVRLFGASKMKTVRTIFSHLRLLGRVACTRFGLNSGLKGDR